VNFDVSVNGRSWKVALEPADGQRRFAVTIKGRRREIDVSWVDADTLSVVDGGRSREIRLHRRAGKGAMGIEIAGLMWEAVAAVQERGRVQVSGSSAGKIAPDAVSTAARDVRHAILAPMPGRIVRLLVDVGDRVGARQGVVVVEAMKMENELRAPGDGVVTAINVKAGAAVDKDAVLMVIEEQRAESLEQRAES
jgi:biotin carboxyl carrier protein